MMPNTVLNQQHFRRNYDLKTQMRPMPMKISKPKSANTSPTRTLLANITAPHIRYPPVQTPDCHELIQRGVLPNHKQRPLSWHHCSYAPIDNQLHLDSRPFVSHIPPQHGQHQSTDPEAGAAFHGMSTFPGFHAYSPTSSVYSSDTWSPVMFSPVTTPYSAAPISQPQVQQQPHYLPAGHGNSALPKIYESVYEPSQHPVYNSSTYPQQNGAAQLITHSTDTIAYDYAYGMQTTPISAGSLNLSPVTPDAYIPPFISEKQISSDVNLDQVPSEEEEGEILVGIGLYDPPEHRIYAKPLLLHEAWKPPGDNGLQ